MSRMPAWRPCLTCGDEFIVAKFRPAQAYCSDRCRGRRLDPAWRTCGHCERSYQARATRVRKGEGLQYCSRECAYGDGESWRRKARSERLTAEIETLRYWARRPLLGDCGVCGRTYRRVQHNQEHCSRSCSYETMKRRAMARSRAQYERDSGEVECDTCGVKFWAERRSNRRRFCSRRCARDHHNHLRRAVFVEPVPLGYLLERDRGTCQLCGGRVSTGKRWPDPASPSIDHIVPVSLGGVHEKANTQLAHLGCNMSKGNRSAGSQLLCLG